MNKGLRRTAVAGAAALALAAGSGAWAATSASASSETVIPKCAPGQLGVWVNVDSGNGAAGSIYYHLDFTNTSRTTCHLYGYPGVSATSPEGTQLGNAAARDNAVPASYVNIPPGGTAHAVLRFVEVKINQICKPTAATFLKVYPPDDFGARHAFFSLPACTVKGYNYLTIRRVQPGA